MLLLVPLPSDWPGSCNANKPSERLPMSWMRAAPSERVAILLGHQSVRVTEKYYAALTDARQRQVEADLERAWERDPIILLASKGTQKLRRETEVVNGLKANGKKWRRGWESNPRIKVLQTSPLPLGYRAGRIQYSEVARIFPRQTGARVHGG